MGIYPDREHINRAMKKHGGVGDFPEMYFNRETVPLRTIFVRGPHEDHKWLNYRKETNRLEMLPNLTMLTTGYRTIIDQNLRIVGVGGVYSEKHYHKSKEGKYYTQNNIQSACSLGGTDILLTHTGPGNLGVGIRATIHYTRPKLFVHATHLNTRIYEVLGSPAIALAKNSLVMVEYSNYTFSVIC
jgi:hypothetical protein